MIRIAFGFVSVIMTMSSIIALVALAVQTDVRVQCTLVRDIQQRRQQRLQHQRSIQLTVMQF